MAGSVSATKTDFGDSIWFTHLPSGWAGVGFPRSSAVTRKPSNYLIEDDGRGWWWRMMAEDGDGRGWWWRMAERFYSTLVCKQGRPLTVVVDLRWLEHANPAPMLCTKTTTRSSCLLLPPQGMACGWLLTLWDLSRRVANFICSSRSQRSQWQLVLLNDLAKLRAGH